MIEIELPDGSIAEFPDGTSTDAIKGALQKRFSANVRQPDADPRNSLMGRVDTFMRGAADTMSFGLSDEIAAQARSGPLSVQKKPDEYYDKGIYAGEWNPLGMIARGLDAPFASETKNEDYDRALAEERATDAADAKNRLAERFTGQILGAITGGAGLAKKGLSATYNAVKAGKSLGGVSKASALESAILSGLQGFGSGEGIEDRLYQGGLGAAIGIPLGAALPGAVTAVGGALKGLTRPIMAPFQPEKYADDAMATYLRRSGKSPEEIVSIMRSAADDGQEVYAVADAMGHAGRRALVPTVRTPNDARQEIVDALIARQMGQPDRLSNALAEAFDAPITSNALSKGLKDARTKEANALYGATRGEATPVNVSPVLEEIDKTLSPGVNKIVSPRDKIGLDTIEGSLSRVRGMLSDGNSQVTDFDALFRAKLDLDDMIEAAKGRGANNRAFYLKEVKNRIDEALEEASSRYRQANDTFRQRSEVMDAVETGSAAKSGRVRSKDSIATFNELTPDQQQGFRSGYVDPIIADVESRAMGPGTNRARMLTTPKYREEFQAFATPGEAQRLGNRIGRENRMFETNQAALGNSKTADNIADIDDAANFDPAILVNLLSGNYKQAALTGVRQALNAGKGLPSRVVERTGRTLMETNPEKALAALQKAKTGSVSKDRLQAMIMEMLLGGQAAGIGQSTSGLLP